MIADMRRLRVTVTAEDIARGRPTATRCPLARAIRRVTKARPVAVFETSYQAGWDYPEYPVPVDATVFVRRFDNRMTDLLRPAVFYLEGPDR